MDYQNYKVTDFIKDEAFFRWVIQPNERSDGFWATWLEQHPNKRKEVEEARWYILRIRELSKNHSAISDQKKQYLMDRIDKTLELLGALQDQSNQKQ